MPAEPYPGGRIQLVLDCIAAIARLARASVVLNHGKSAGLGGRIARGPTTGNLENSALGTNQDRLVRRLAYVIPRVAQRLPWRADCLVQALAGQNWLLRAGIGSQIVLGVPIDQTGDFEAHAWLVAGDRIVTGGDVSNYRPLVPLSRRQNATSTPP